MSFEPIRIGNTVIRRSSSSSSSSSSKYEIKNEASPFLIKSIGDAIDVKATSTTMTIDVAEVLTMRNYLKRNRHVTELYVALNLVHNLGRQMQSLISAGRSIAYFGVDDVVVITNRESDTFTHESINDLDSTLDDNRMDPQFLFLNDHLIFELDDTGALIIDHALPSNKTKGKGKDKSKSKYAFMSPELQHLSNDATNATPTHAPHAPPHAIKSVHFKTVYYSAAQLVIYFLLNVDRIPDDNAYMDPIKHTKLYWFLLRCLNPVPAERKYIYI
jgi:hypothetical protein